MVLSNRWFFSAIMSGVYSGFVRLSVESNGIKSMNVTFPVPLSNIRRFVCASIAAGILPLCAQPPGRYALILKDEPVAQHVASREGVNSAEGRSWRARIESAHAGLRSELANRQITVAG